VPGTHANARGILAGDRSLGDITDEITGDLKYTTLVVVIDV
jgi:hypothetical protein